MVSNITKRSKSGGIDKVSNWRSPGRNIGVRVSELTGLDMVVTDVDKVSDLEVIENRLQLQVSEATTSEAKRHK